MNTLKFAMVLGLFMGQYAVAEITEESDYEVIICYENGENAPLTINSQDSFLDIMNQADAQADGQDYYLNYSCNNQNVPIAKSAASNPRNYDLKVTPKEKEDIFFIVTTLGRGSLKKLLTAKSSLKKAGARVDHVHPLRFIGCIFSDEEMKVGIMQVKERGGWVAKEFFSGMYESLSTESNNQNLKMEYILDFANSLNIDSNLVLKPIQDKDWKALINILIDVLPRSGNPNRYDM